MLRRWLVRPPGTAEFAKHPHFVKLVEGGGWLRRSAPRPCGLRLRRTQQASLAVEPAADLIHLQLALQPVLPVKHSHFVKLVEGGGFEPPKA